MRLNRIRTVTLAALLGLSVVSCSDLDKTDVGPGTVWDLEESDVIPISTDDRVPKIYTAFNPTWVDGYDPVPAEQRNLTWSVPEVQNIGQAPLEITGAVLTGSPSISVSYPTSMEDFSDPATDRATPPTLVQPGQGFPMRIFWNPVDDNPASADLIFFTNDPDSPQYTVKMFLNSGVPCIKLSPEDEIDFGEGILGLENSKIVTIENCSSIFELEVWSVEISHDGGNGHNPVFGLQDGSLPAGLPGGTAILAPGDTTNFVVTYTPTEEIVSLGELIVRSNGFPNGSTGVLSGMFRLPLVGEGTTAGP